MTRLFAQSYDLSADGFYFDDVETYRKLANADRNSYGQPVEEYEIQFIDGERIDADFARAFHLSQASLSQFFDAVDTFDEGQKVRFIIANGECGYALGTDSNASDVDAIELDLYVMDSLEDLAREFVDEGIFGEVPERLDSHIDYESIARDLSVEYATTDIAGTRYIYRCE